MAMPSPDEIHKQMEEGLRLQKEHELEQIITNREYNEYLVQAKLDPPLYKLFWSYCRKHDLNRSSGVKSILTKFLSINV